MLDLDWLLKQVDARMAAKPGAPKTRAPARLNRLLEQWTRQAKRHHWKPSEVMDRTLKGLWTTEMRKAWSAYRADPGDTRRAEAWDRAAKNATEGYKYAQLHRGEILMQIRRDLGVARLPRKTVSSDRTRRLPTGESLAGNPYAVSVFSGGGLYDLSLFLEGVHVGEVAEIDPRAVETLRTNLHDLASATDALTWTPQIIPPGGIDILTGGPPCQPFSQGRNLGGGYGPSGPADPRNMYPRVLDWVADCSPRILCLENSSKLATNPEYRRYMDWWFSQLAALGYEGTFWVISAASYGTPQDRRRAWAVAWPKGAPWGEGLRQAPPATHGRPGSPGVQSGALLPWTRAFDRLNAGCCAGWGLTTCVNLGNLEGACSTCVQGMRYKPAPNYNVNEMRANLTSSAVRRTMKEKGDSGRFRFQSFRPVEATAASAWEELKTNERTITRYLAPTVTTRILKGAPNGLIVPEGADAGGSVDRYNPQSIRSFIGQLKQMSVRDAAKLQDVPQWYKFEGPRTEQYRQIGNGIPVNMGRAVAAHLLRSLGKEAPMANAMGAKPMQGLWPLDATDMCARFTGLLGYSQSLSFGALRQKTTLSPEERRARPYPTRESFDEMRVERDYALRRMGALHSQMTREEAERQPAKKVGIWLYPGGIGQYVHDPNWRPASMKDFPPGFRDVYEFEQWVSGQGPKVWAHYGAAWHQALGQKAKGAWGERPKGPFPEWSLFNREKPPKGKIKYGLSFLESLFAESESD